MKTYSILLTFVSSLLFAQNYDYHPADWELLNDQDFQFDIPVQKVEAVTYILNSDEGKGEKWQADNLFFEDGKLIKWEQQDFQFGQNFTQEFIYDKVNHTRFAERRILSNEKLIEIAQYTYNEKTKKIEQIDVQEFDEQFENAPPLNFKIDIILDSNNARIKDIYYDYNSNLRNEIEIQTDALGRINARKYFDRAGDWFMTDSIVYNDKNRILEEITIYKNRDANEENILTKIQYEYDENGNISLLKVEDNTVFFQHILDENGYWVERRSYIEIDGESKPYQLVERKIEYE